MATSMASTPARPTATRTRTSKRWHFRVTSHGISVIKDGREMRDRSGKPVGAMETINVPSSRRTCQQAQAYLDHALEVSIPTTNTNTNHKIYTVGVTMYIYIRFVAYCILFTLGTCILYVYCKLVHSRNTGGEQTVSVG